MKLLAGMILLCKGTCAPVASLSKGMGAVTPSWTSVLVSLLATLHTIWKCAWSTQENFRFLLCGCYMYNYWGDRTHTGLCEPLWSICLNCQLMLKLEMTQIFQARVCGCINILTHIHGCLIKKRNGKLVVHACIKKSAKSSKFKYSRTYLKFGSENQLNAHNYLSTGTPERGSMTGALRPAYTEGGRRGQWCLFGDNITGNFMVCQERFKTKFCSYSRTQKNSE